MRYAIFSDIHSNLEAFDAIVEAFKYEAVDQYLCVGDFVGYGANPVECIARLQTLNAVTVLGNHDLSSIDMYPVDYFNPEARAAIFWTRRKLGEEHRQFIDSLKLVYKNEDLTLVHGSLNEPMDFNYLVDSVTVYKTLKLLHTAVCFVGHTHLPCIFVKDFEENVTLSTHPVITVEHGQKYIVNVGSVGQPRDGNPDAAYCIYDTQKRQLTLKRIMYDVKTARQKIIDAGLPAYLGDRLLRGK